MFEWLRRAQFTGVGATTPPTNPLLVSHTPEREEVGIDKINEDLNPRVDNDWHGYVFLEHGGVTESIYIAPLADHRFPCFFTEKIIKFRDEGISKTTSEIKLLATFRSEGAAKEALKWLDRLGQSFVRLTWYKGGD